MTVTLGGLLPVIAAMLSLLAAAGALGIAAAPLIERRRNAAVPVGLLLGIGIALASTVVTLAWMLRIDVAATAIGLTIAGAVGAVTVVIVALARHGRSALRLQERQLGTALISVLVAVLVLAPLAVQGFAAWTAFINDFHRYAASAMVWTAETSNPGSYLETFTGHFGETTFGRAGFEKPMTTGLLVWASALTGLAPTQLLTPTVLALIVTTMGVVAALLRLALAVPSVGASAIAVVAALSPAAWARVMDAQIGQQHSVAMGFTVLAVITMAARARPERIRGGAILIGITLAAMIGSSATLAIATMPVIGMLALTLAVRGASRPRVVGLLTAGSIAVATVLVTPLVGAIARSLRIQTVGLDELPPLPLVHPVELVGIAGGGPTEAAAALWLGVLCTTVTALWFARRPRLDAGVVAATAGSALLVGGLYGLDSYEFGKWLALVVPLIGALVLGALVTRLNAQLRPIALAALVGLAVSAAVAAALAAGAIDRVIPAGTAALADDPVVSALDAVTVDTGDTYRDSIVPLMVNVDRVATAGDTYSAGGPPLGDAIITTEARAVERGWVVERALAGDLVLARAPIAIAAGTTLTGSEIAPHLFGGWLAPEAGGVWSGGGGPVWLALDLGDGGTATTLRLSLLVPASEAEPRILTLMIGERRLRFPPSDRKSVV